MMRTENQAEHGVIQSSIVLLQERFKQLQRVKEMREKKELLRLFSEYQNNNTNNNNNNNNIESSTSHNTTIINNDDDDEIQIFLPPNYYYNSRKPSFYSSPSSSSSSSSLSHNNHKYHNYNLNAEISLSLWPSAMSSYNNATAADAHCRRAPIARPPSCAFKLEDCQHHHFSADVDTTLHL